LRRLFALAKEWTSSTAGLVLVVNRLRQDALPAELAAIRAETNAHDRDGPCRRTPNWPTSPSVAVRSTDLSADNETGETRG